jgi:hypothetical protein
VNNKKGFFSKQKAVWLPAIFGKILNGHYAKKIDDFTSEKI